MALVPVQGQQLRSLGRDAPWAIILEIADLGVCSQPALFCSFGSVPLPDHQKATAAQQTRDTCKNA